MQSLQLVYDECPTTGLPTVTDPAGRLGEKVLSALQREIDGQYEKLVANSGQVVAFAALAGADAPRTWRVAAEKRSGRRCPKLTFEPVEDGAPEPAMNDAESPVGVSTSAGPEQERATPAVHWTKNWLDEADHHCRQWCEQLSDYQQVKTVLTEARELAARKPAETSLILLAGYLYVAKSIDRHNGACPADHYDLAGEALADICRDVLPPGVFTGLAQLDVPDEPAPPEPRRSWWARWWGEG